jgi:hypothetical protein
MKNKKGSVDWTLQPSLSWASFKLHEPPILLNLASSKGSSSEIGAHGDGVAELHAPTITTLL